MKKLGFLFLFLPYLISAQNEQILYQLVELNKEVNSRYHESAPLVTPDNQRLYFTISNHPENNEGRDNSQDIWYSDKQADGSWGQAIHMESPFNKRKFNQVYTILDEGNALFIRGGRNKNKDGFSIVTKDNKGWGKTEELEVEDYEEMNQGVFSGATISQDRSAIIIYMNERSKKPYSDLYLSMRKADGNYSKPIMIKSLSTYKDEFGPYLTENDKVMYYASNRDGGMGGVDIWKVKRLDDSWLNWSEPENIGTPINTDGFDSYFSVDETGNNAFTTRTYVSADGSNMNVYGLIPKAKIIVKGQVFNAASKEPLAVYLTAEPEGSKALNFDVKSDGKYKFTTYQNKNFSFISAKIGYEQLNETLDLTNILKDTVINKDFYLTPIETKVTLNGLITDARTLNPVNAKVIVKKKNFTDSAGTRFKDGGYAINLNGAGDYEIRVLSDEYEDIIEAFSVKIPEGEYTYEIRKDYQMNKAYKPYLISGIVIDEKSKEPLEAELSFEIQDSTFSSLTSNTDGTFQLKVPKHGELVIRGKKINYLNLEDSLTIGDNQDFREYSTTLEMSPIEVGKTVIINNIYFNFDKTTLKEVSFPELDRLTDLMIQNAGIKIDIIGHTDSKGSDDYNLTLSEGRAQSVMEYLIEKGIASDRMTAKGMGETAPINSNDTDEGRAKNRRVEFTIVAK
ncbi:OmpA family protein [Marivirga harenae]|uniref:OmpA family protein n=1 Tax=Marivirga harenae TaxID=2010992 RepID=UPI0026E08882|nr:OmpA family protein [Marivirga harenae]WKV11076.1 OmpA family protein [Marivirga harenae]|tara:strand:- start:171904 stop:173943 length:2040 start_codon:yes stop_codon:yes gene_type:complete